MTHHISASFPIELFESVKQYDTQLGDTTSILDADKDVLRDYINRFQLGLWPNPNLTINNYIVTC